MADRKEAWETAIADSDGISIARFRALRIECVNEESCELGVSVSISRVLGLDFQTQFSGSAQVWIDGSDLNRFLVELTELERTRIGTATLHSMSPRELKLVFRSIDRLGHMTVAISLGAELLCDRNRRYYTATVSFECEIDPGSLPRCLTDFQLLHRLIRHSNG